MYRANVQRTGIYNTQGINNLRGIKWKLKIESLLGDFSRIGLNCPLIIANGVLYLCDLKGYLYAVNSQTGKENWRIHIDNKILDNLTFDDNIIYLSSADGDFYAVDVKTKQIKWKSPINFVHHPSPIVFDRLLFVDSQDGILYAININNGQPCWRFKTTKNMAITPPALNNGLVYVGSEDGKLYAIDAETGREKWKCRIGPLPRYSVPIIANNIVYIGVTNNFLYGIDAETGVEIFQLQVQNKYSSFNRFVPPVIDNKFIYAATFCRLSLWDKHRNTAKILGEIEA